MKEVQNKNQSLLKDFLADYQLTRRSFMKKATAATGSAVALGSLKPSLKALAATTEEPAKALGEWVASTCQGCTSWCSKQVYPVNGRAIKVRGNPKSKINGTASCPRAHLALQQVYDPDRIKTPMKRTNPQKGRHEDPKFVPLSWDEALNNYAGYSLRSHDQNHRFTQQHRSQRDLCRKGGV